MRLRFFSLASASLLVPAMGAAQSGAPLETEIDVESVIVLTPYNDTAAPLETEPVLGELSLNLNSEKVLENGVRLRARGALRLQRDHPSRPGGTGGFGSDPIAPTGAFSGLSNGAPGSRSDTRTRLETAYLQIDGGYGEIRFGKDQGVAARFHEGPRSVLSHARLDSPLLDPTGINTIRSRHDLTGPSAKISYASPRILGLRGGVSFTPNADADGLDRRPSSGTGGLAPDLDHAIELALNGTRRLTDSGLRIDFGAAWSQSSVDNTSALAPYEQVETWSAGTRLEKDDWTIGASWLQSNNGLPTSDYTSWSTGLHREAYNTDFSIEYGESSDDNLGLNAHGWRFGAARDLTPNMRLAVAFLNDTSDLPTQKWDAQGVVVEITLLQEIVEVTGN